MNGYFELNSFNPLIISNLLNSIYFLSNAIDNFNMLLANIDINNGKFIELIENTIFNIFDAYFDFDNYNYNNLKIDVKNSALKIAKYSYDNNLSLLDAALKCKIIKEKDYNEVINN